MFLAGHASVGIAITAALGVTNPAAAFALGWASHYLADFFPHGDEFRGLRVHQTRLQGGDASSDSYCFPSSNR